MKRKRANILWIIFLTAAAVIFGALAAFVFDNLREKSQPQVKIPAEISAPQKEEYVPLAVSDDEKSTDEAPIVYAEDLPENQAELKKLIETQKQKRGAQPQSKPQDVDLSVYQVNPRTMEKDDLVPNPSAPRSGKLTPKAGVERTELPPGGFEPPKRLSIPIESLDIRKIKK